MTHLLFLEKEAQGKSSEYQNMVLDCRERLFKINSDSKEQDKLFETKGRDKHYLVKEADIRNEINACAFLVLDIGKLLAKNQQKKKALQGDLQQQQREEKQYKFLKKKLLSAMNNRGVIPPQ